MSDHDEQERVENAEMRNLWNQLKAPDATPETFDKETQAAVDWMRAAWTELEAPEVKLPARLRFRLLRSRRRWLLPIATAAAALVLFAWPTEPTARHEPEEPVEILARVDSPEIHDEAPPTSAPKTTITSARHSRFDEERNAIVMEHGKVRLILLTAIEDAPTIPNSAPLEDS
ncbi:MAG: hypothetical protein ACI8X5_000686 [Planctomycetota bacterium]|jgi:hypothetical protein